jgi:hypothetical protein
MGDRAIRSRSVHHLKKGFGCSVEMFGFGRSGYAIYDLDKRRYGEVFEIAALRKIFGKEPFHLSSGGGPKLGDMSGVVGLQSFRECNTGARVFPSVRSARMRRASAALPEGR